MHIVLPKWMAHLTEKGRPMPIYSIHAHPVFQKVATAGQDCKIKIWNTVPITDKAAEENPEVPKLLSSLSLHNGAVLCVRWANGEGRFLASGSDDTKIIIWELSGSGSKTTFGDLDGATNKEVYRPVKVLMGHESDVADVAWSPDNSFLASAAFDSKIIIWDGSTFDRIKVIEGHTGFVKGLTWDPVGKYLASQSDDKTVKVWRASDWALEEQVTAPFEHSATVSFFRRLSWSPEGSCIATANGENSGLCIAPIVNRDGWNADVFLVGHQAPIEVVAFNPVIFEIPASHADKSKKTISAVCAVGSQDNSISIWWTSKARSVAVAKHVFSYSVLDLSWTSDGLCLFACSYDGSTAALMFEDGEFGVPLAGEEKDRALSKYGYQSRKNVTLESPEQMQLEEESMLYQASSNNRVAASTIGFSAPAMPTPSFAASFSNVSKESTPQKQTTTVTRDGKKRIHPIFIAGNATTGTTALPPSVAPQITTSTPTKVLSNGVPLSIPTAMPSEKRKADEVWSGDAKRGGGMVGAGSQEVRSTSYVLPTWIDSKAPVNLGIPEVEKRLAKNILLSEDPLEEVAVEAQNSNNRCQIICRRKELQVWRDLIPMPVIHLGGTSNFFAASTVDGRLYIYSLAGRRLLPISFLDSALSFLVCEREYLMYITSTGYVSVLNVATEECVVPSSPVGHLLRLQTNDDGTKSWTSIVSVSILLSGMPVFTTSAEETFTYHAKLKTWMRVGDSQSVKFQLGKGITDSLIMMEQTYGNLLSLTQIENFMACALQLESLKEYRYWLKVYARRLSDENSSSKIEELCYLLLGTHSGSSQGKNWDPLILGTLPKKELLKELLPIFGKNRSLQRLIQSIDGAVRLKESANNMF